MKLSGMHSYRELQEIDFEKLCEAGLFGIFGPTGSGKSTILDAITLALYGQVVRQGGKSHPLEALNQLEQRLFVSFTFEIGKEGERRRYTIEREFGLDRKGNRRQPEVRLIECGRGPEEEDRVIESKANAVTAAVENLIGLTLQDFTRAVVLPQGQFARFLTLKSSERNDMLQRMFNLHEYGEKLNERLRDAYETNRQERHRLELELAALGDVGPEALASAKEEWEAASRQEKLYRDQQEKLEERRREAEQIHGWQEELAAIRQRLADLEEQKEEMEALAARVAAVEASGQVWPLVQKARQLDEEWRQAEEALQARRREHDAAVDRMAESERDYQTAAGRLRTDEPRLIEQKSKLAEAVQLEEELAALRAELTAGSEELAALQGELALLTEQIGRQEEEIAGWEAELKELDGKLQEATVSPQRRAYLQELRDAKQAWERELGKQRELERECADAEKAIHKLDAQLKTLLASWQEAAREREETQRRLAEAEEQPVADERELEAARETLAQVKALGREWRDAIQRLADWQRRWTENEPLWQAAASRAQAAGQRAAEAEEMLEGKKRELEELRTAWLAWQKENMTRLLRSTLAEGEACPVCGSTHHPYHGEEVAWTAAEAARQEAEEKEWNERLQTAEAAWKTAEEDLTGAREKWHAAKVEQAAVEQRKIALTEEKAALDARIQAIAAECGRLGPSWVVTEIEQLLQRYREAEAALRHKTEERERHKALLEEMRDLLARQRERELEQKALYEKQAAVLGEWQEKQRHLAERLQEAAGQADRLEASLRARCTDMPLEEIEAAYARVAELDKLGAHLKNQRAQREEQLQQAKAAAEQAKSERTKREIREAALRERLQERKLLWEEKRNRWLERTAGQQAAQLLADVEERLTSLRSACAEAEQKHLQAVEQRQTAHALLVKTEEACAQLTRQREEAEASLQQALRAHGFEQIEQVEALFGEREQLAGWKAQIAEFQTLRTQLAYEAERLTQKLAGRSITTEEWQSVMQGWAELQEALQTAREAVAVARERVTNITASHEKWQTLQAQLQDAADEQSRLEELRKLFEGKAFVQFIAEERLAAIARDASYHLKRMTNNRYALELGDDGEFVLRDEGTGGIRRPVSTLSGGETFLTSLALALALSVEIQMRGGRLEFFFLDEGFGTLDPELLEVVMDALERLRMSDFTIGLISHVPELRVRMPRRLVITPAEPLGAGSRIALEID
nr:SMC family ATPase [Brevibacillus sp. SYP-B805]